MASPQVQEIINQMSSAIGDSSGLGGTLKFDFGEPGSVYVDGKSTPNSVSDGDGKTADCTISVTLETFEKMVKGELDGTSAFMQGKLRVAGDMGLAMKLGPVLQKSARLIATQFITTPQGHRLRTATFDAQGEKRRGLCVLLHGQTEFIEKYEEVIGELRGRGFAVATFDWPGQGGSYRLLDNPLKAHIDDFSTYDAALWAFYDQIVKPLSDKSPMALAHSMGGHILLRALHDKPNAFSRAVLSAPMLRALTRGYPAWLARAACAFENLIGAKDEWVWGMDARDPHLITFDTQLVTSDRARFQRAQDLAFAHPELRLAGPTWGWLEAAYRTMATVMTPAYAAAISTPVLMIGAGKDRIVDVTAEREFARWLPHGQYIEFPDAEHEIMMESDPIRAKFWSAFDAFVGTSVY